VPPISRAGQARDVAAAAVFHAGEDAGGMTGTTLPADGGMGAAAMGCFPGAPVSLAAP
jgi:NAD(P)-dependent dehydrogenase (short-subunit alcohol dehydrogenase family)